MLVLVPRVLSDGPDVLVADAIDDVPRAVPSEEFVIGSEDENVGMPVLSVGDDVEIRFAELPLLLSVLGAVGVEVMATAALDKF